MYKTNWGIGHGLKDILEVYKGPFTGQGHNGLYEILTSWHAHQWYRSVPLHEGDLSATKCLKVGYGSLYKKRKGKRVPPEPLLIS